MRNAFCSVLAYSLALLASPSIWGEQTPEISDLSGQTPRGGPVDSVATTDAPQVSAKPPVSTTAPAQMSDPDPAVSDADPPPAMTEATDRMPTYYGHRSSAYQSWVDKVRAQRQARMAEYREAMESRRNYHAPWDHQQYETIERQREKQRSARQNRAEWREQAQRAHRRWTNPRGEFVKDMHEAHRQLMEAQAETQRKQMDLLWQQQEQWISGQMPHGWNNPWYYRGY